MIASASDTAAAMPIRHRHERSATTPVIADATSMAKSPALLPVMMSATTAASASAMVSQRFVPVE